MTPEETLANLKADASRTIQRSLDVVHEVCREQFNRGSTDFRFSTIGSMSQARGGPATGTIRNTKSKGGQKYYALIQAWKSHVEKSSGQRASLGQKRKRNPYEAELRGIADPGVRAIFTGVVARLSQVESELRILKQHKALLIDLRSEDARRAATVTAPIPPLTSGEKAALEKAISKKFLDKQGWKAHANGAVVNVRDRPVYPPGYLSGIRKIIEALAQT